MNTRIILLCTVVYICLIAIPDHCSTCSTNCQTCRTNGLSQTCTTCNDGYWLSGSSCQPCLNKCATCFNAYSCETCKPGFHAPSLSCSSPCSNNCLDGLCNETTGHCSACPINSYGYYCDYECGFCKNEQCQLRKCTDGCKTGYWQYQDGEHFQCKVCKDNCALCDDWSICDVCNDGTYPNLNTLEQIISCLLCRSNCETCSSHTFCSTCKPGYFGDVCEFSCSIQISNCYKCDWDRDASISSVTCNQCVDDFTLQNNTCVVAEQQCPTNCESCTVDNECDDPCYDILHCDACQETGGSIVCSVCDEGYTVADGGCIIMTSQPTSAIVAPTSTMQTKAQVVPTSITSSLSRNTTFHPASITFTPVFTTPSSLPDRRKTQSNNNYIMIGAIAGGVGLILVVVVVLTLCLIKRRKTNARNNQHGIAEGGQHMEEDLTDYPVYAKPNKAKKAQPPEEYIYAQPNKLKKSNQQRTLDVKEDSHNNVAISLDMETDMAETDVDDIQLETLEGELTSEIETGVDIPSSDTYYNVEGLLRSRVEVPNLLEYVGKKHDFDSEFQKLPKGLIRSCNEALRVHNRKKNRYNGIYAYDATRVVLGSKSYINANHIDGHNKSNAYIASLGPTSDTMNKFSTFWEMVWQEGIEAIVMLTNLEEREKMKCEQYWPNPGTTKTCHDYIVHCTAENVFAEFAVRELTLEKIGVSERRGLRQYHYTAWPDRYVPDTVASLVEFRDKVEEINRRTESPIVVHCSAGIGRTGTYIALDLLIKEGRDCNYVDMFGCALGLRGQRVNLIQNEEQYEYLHHAVLYSLSCYTEPLSFTSFNKLMSEERIASQFKALKALPVQSKRLSLWTSNYTDRKENRAGADIPCDSYRVRLLSTNMDYINAVYVNSYQRKNAYIAAQTPMPSTVEDFLSMVYAERCPCIICLDEENPTLKSVAEFLPEVNETSMFGQYQIHCEGINTCDDYIIRDVVVFRTPTDKLKLQHYQFRKWKAGDIVPSSKDAFLNFVTKVGSTVNDQHGPVLLHCLTGSHRCGVFCAVSTMIEKLAIDRHISGIHSFSHIRSRRSTALQKQEMFKFCYHCVADYINLSSNRDNYYNVLVPNCGQ